MARQPEMYVDGRTASEWKRIADKMGKTLQRTQTVLTEWESMQTVATTTEHPIKVAKQTRTRKTK